MSYIKPFTQSSNPSNSGFSSGFWVPNSEIYGQLIVTAARHCDCSVRTADLIWVLKIVSRTPEERPRIHSVTHSFNHSQPKICIPPRQVLHLTLHYHVEGDIQRVGCTNTIN